MTDRRLSLTLSRLSELLDLATGMQNVKIKIKVKTWQTRAKVICRYHLSCHVMSYHGRHLGFDQPGNSAIRSAYPENSAIEPNIKWIRITRCGDMAILNSTYHEDCIRDLTLGKGEVVDRTIRKSDGGFL